MSDSGHANITRRSFVAAGAWAAGAAGAMAAVQALALTGCASHAQDAGSQQSSLQSPAGHPITEGAVAHSQITATFSEPSSESPNPVGVATPLMFSATQHVFEGLYNLDLHTYRTYSGLAAGEPTPISDTEFEVTLREGAQFSDGGEVEPVDVVNAFYANMESSTFGQLLDFIDSVAEKEGRTISFTLKHPIGHLLKQRLALVKVYPSWMTDEQLGERPLGTGPWAYDEIDGADGGHITFVPNEFYDGIFPAETPSMRWEVASKAAQRVAALQEQKTAVAEDVPEADAAALREAGATVEFLQGFSPALLVFNCLKEPFDDVRVRRAILYAIDSDRLVEKALDGHARTATSFLPKSNPYYHEASTVYVHDRKKAQSLLAEARVRKLECELLVEDVPWISALAAQIKDDLAAIGVTVKTKVASIDWAVLEPASEEPAPDEGGWPTPEEIQWTDPATTPWEDPSASGEEPAEEVPEPLSFDLALTTDDPSRFGNDPDLLMRLLYGDTAWTQSRTGWAHAEGNRCEELRELLDKAIESEDELQQTLWNKCFDLVSSEVPLYPLLHREIATAYQSPLISGFEPIATSGLSLLGSK